MKKAKKFLAAFLSLAIIIQLFSAVGFVNAAAGDYAGMVLNFETGTQDTATGTHSGYADYYGDPTKRSGNATSYNDFKVGYVNGSGIGHNNSDGAMKMYYSGNSPSKVNTAHAAFNVAHTGTSATKLENYRPQYGQMFRATVWYRVESITADAQLAFYIDSRYEGNGKGVDLNWGGAPAGTPFAKLTAADTQKGWQSASVVFMGGGQSTATATGSGSAGYIELIMSDDTNRVGTEIYVDDITIEHIGAAVEVKYDANGGNMTGSAAQYGLAGDTLTGTATREDAQFLGWYTDKEFTQRVTAIPESSCTVYAKWKVLSYAGMKLNFETGTQDTATGTHPAYESYYGTPDSGANGNATRVNGFKVGYVNEEGIGRNNSNGAMKMAYSKNSDTPVTTYAAFNTAHTGTSPTNLENFRPYYGQMFEATVWYRVESITADAQLAFYTGSKYSGTGGGANLTYGGAYAGTPFAKLTDEDIGKGWQSATVRFMGGGTSTKTATGSGSAGYIELIMSDDTNRVGTVVYVDDIEIKHIGEAIEVKYNANGGTVTGNAAQYGLAGDALTGTAEREGYEFLGWYTDKEGTAPITAIPESGCTVYAKWEIKEYAGMVLNFETGDRNTETGTHPGYEAYYGKPEDAANGNATRVEGLNVGYVNGDGLGHNSNGAMKMSYSTEGSSLIAAENAAFNTAHTGTSAKDLANYRPYYGQMFRATVWYKAAKLTSDAELGFFVISDKDKFSRGVNLTSDKITPSANTCGDGGVWHTLATLEKDKTDGEWHQATVEFMGGGSSDFTTSNWGSNGFIVLVMNDDTKRLGTEVYIDDITIEHIGAAVKVNYDLDGGTVSNSNGAYEYGLAGATLKAVAVKSGYNFIGWCDENGNAVTVIPETDGETLYAKYERNSETINGDFDGDGVLNAGDLIIMRQFLLGIITDEKNNYDVNGDNDVDVRDLVCLKKLIVAAAQSSVTLMNLMDGKGGADTEGTALRSKIQSLDDIKPAAGTTVYYVSNSGSDDNGGTSRVNPFKSMEKAASLLKDGDTLLLQRGSVFRLSRSVTLSSGITLGAYGTGAKPEIWGSAQNYAGKGLWKKSIHKDIWTLDYTGNGDVGIIVFNNGEAAGRKVYKLNELKEYFDFAYIDGKIYLYCPKDPNAYSDIEIGDHMGLIGIEKGSSNVTVSNITLKYTGAHAIWSAGNVKNITVTGCEIGWIGGSIQGTNDNYTLYGNGIEFWNTSEDITVKNNWVYQVYDAGITFQGYGTFKNISFSENLIEYTTMSIEYWNMNHDGDITGISIDNNIIRFSGYGWGAKRVYNGRTAHINVGHTPTDYKNLEVSIMNNIFDCSYQVIFRVPWVSNKPENQRYTITGNTYYQRSRTGENDLGLGGVENAAFAYGVLEGQNDISSTASNQTEFETAVKAVDTAPKLVRWIDG